MATTERRQGVRRTLKSQIRTGTLLVRGREVPVLVVDHSVRGLGVVGVNLRSLAIGSEVSFASKTARGMCRVASSDHLSVAGTEVYRVGLEWLDS